MYRPCLSSPAGRDHICRPRRHRRLRHHGNNHDHPRGGDHDVHGRDVYDRYWSYPPLRGLASVSLLKVSARVGRLISNGVLALGFLAIEQPVERYEDKRDIPAVNVGLDEAEEEA